MGLATKAAVVVIACAIAGAVACSRSDAQQGAAAPPPPRPLAAEVLGVRAVPDERREASGSAARVQQPSPVVSPEETLGPDACPDTMVLVDGDRCTEVQQECVEWLDPKGSRLARCARFAPSVCKGHRQHERFCIDRDEYVAPGETLPEGGASWIEARTTCRREGKRLCRESEWELACEGEDALPYTTGYARDATACNFDRDHLVDPDTRRLRDQREPPSSLDRCVSPYGVRSMTGNVDEWVWRDHTSGPFRSALKGGWWMAARERCRPATTWHNEHYRELQTGFRCCADSPG